MAVGIAFWSAFATPYAAMLARAAEGLIRMFERPAVTRLHARGDEIVIDRSDFRASDKRPATTTAVLTVNAVLLVCLFFANRRPWSTENVRRLGIALLALVPVHILALVANVQSTYALLLGPWSAAHYGVVARNFWAAATHGYLLIGGFAITFVLWWIFRADSDYATPMRRNRSGSA